MEDLKQKISKKYNKKEEFVIKDEELKNKHRDNERYGDRDRDNDRDRGKYKDREKHKEKHREERKEDRENERERMKEKEIREKERSKLERRERREKEGQGGEKTREKRRGVERDYNDGGVDDVKDRDRKRRRREDGYTGSSKGSSRRREDSVDNNGLKKTDENCSYKDVVKMREEDMEEGQQKLDDEMEKRKRRVQEWHEKRRKKEEYERARFGGIDESAGKTWTLDGECEGTADGGHMDLDDNVKGTGKINGVVNGLDDGDVVHALPNGGDMEEDEIDPLDAFMNSIVIPEVNKLSYSEASVLDEKSSDSKKDDKNKDNQQKNKKSGARSLGWIIPGDDSEEEYPDIDKEEDGDAFMKRVKKSKLEKLSLVDHSTINYFEFRKNFYIEVNEIKKMTQDEVATYRKELELKVHGKDVPKPIKTWYQTGLTTKILETIRTLKYDKPMPIQAQAFPVIMSGRDCIGPKLCSGDGPIGLVMAPTRELVRQLHGDIRKFTKVLDIRCVPVYGGSGVAQRIKELKRGAEIVVCTPGRMIDVLCTSGGKITNLRRVSYLVMDEADRMFDMGFEPQITRIVHNIQPNRQTVLFSATFPRKVEILARKVLNKPVEIQVGGRSVVNKDITQLVEVRPENERFSRLLELIREWYSKGKILVFVQSQNKCDALFTDLYKHGFKCLSLHGAKDQSDRESTISDFKSNVCG
ncbi:putative RNA helicase [Helianthus annuus]|nr:putative RNA helicase [Helianthus annuus]KAJ0737071.1 putative RNA helicase [Helianthus annuus]